MCEWSFKGNKLCAEKPHKKEKGYWKVTDNIFCGHFFTSLDRESRQASRRGLWWSTRRLLRSRSRRHQLDWSSELSQRCFLSCRNGCFWGFPAYGIITGWEKLNGRNRVELLHSGPTQENHQLGKEKTRLEFKIWPRKHMTHLTMLYCYIIFHL